MGDTRKNPIGMEFSWIPPGSFVMGSPSTESQRGDNEGPQRQVTLRQGFWMGRYEVTREEYEAVMGYGSNLGFKDCGNDCPIESVSWLDAKDFLKRLNEMNDGFVYSLPTEAEWEYAARAGTTTAFAFGDSLGPGQAHIQTFSGFDEAISGQRNRRPKGVGRYNSNAWGLYDMHGNVWEWVEDVYQGNYAGLAADGSANTEKGDISLRVFRGGSWDSLAGSARSAVRGRRDPSTRENYIGFRVVARPRPQAVGEIRRNSFGMEFSWVPPGSFTMGSPSEERDRGEDEGPQRVIDIKTGFWMGRHEVTQGQFKAVMGTQPSRFDSCGADCPVENVSWWDAQDFIKKLNERNDGFVYSLPSEAEWEYAARAGSKTVFAFGDALSSNQANFDGTRPYGSAPQGPNLDKTTKVGSYEPNAWGLHDMHGNVWEWVEDVWRYAYEGLPTDGSANTTAGESGNRVLRGGSWGYGGATARSAERLFTTRNLRSDIFGFRVVARSR